MGQEGHADMELTGLKKIEKERKNVSTREREGGGGEEERERESGNNEDNTYKTY